MVINLKLPPEHIGIISFNCLDSNLSTALLSGNPFVPTPLSVAPLNATAIVDAADMIAAAAAIVNVVLL